MDFGPTTVSDRTASPTTTRAARSKVPSFAVISLPPCPGRVRGGPEGFAPSPRAARGARTPAPGPVARRGAACHPPGVDGPTRAASGCLLCGEELVYLDATEPMPCAGCGAVRPSRTRCPAGHFLCDACHSGDANDAVERVCAAAGEADPVAIALRAMRHPRVRMHGPEHHFLVPAALLAAWCNARGAGGERAARVAEARRRAAPLVGGMCGTQGACGAAIGTGIFATVVLGVTPLSADGWGRAQR